MTIFYYEYAGYDRMAPMDGIMRCSRYSFGPNRLHYCGPDANKELRELIENDGDNFGVAHILKQFKTLFPYLKHISQSNGIVDPFDNRVVEAYWLGNDLLKAAERKALFDFLVNDMRVRDKINSKKFSWLEEKIRQGAAPHHSFHVLNVWQQNGHGDSLEDIERMGECLISSGRVVEINGPEISVMTEPLIFSGTKFALGEPVLKKITRELQCEYDIEQIKPGQIVSIHWSVPCEIITEKQQENLRKITLKNIEFANQTI